MKNILIIISLSLAINVNGQDAISRFFDEYASDESFSNVTITSRMFGLFTDLEMESKEDQEVLDAISKLKGLKILAKDETNGSGKKMYREALAMLPSGEFEELMTIRDGNTDMKFMIKESGKIINELVMVLGGDDEFFILTLFGEIDLKQMAKLSKAMDIDGLDNLKNLDN